MPLAAHDSRAPQRIRSFSEIAAGYDLLICDIWGIVHDGVSPHRAAGEALARYRAGGGTVVLVSNAPRPHDVVRRQMDRIGVRDDAADAIVTSGDVTVGLIAERPGQPFYLLGLKRDVDTFGALGAKLSSIDQAAYVVCTGLINDDYETPDDYRDILRAIRDRGLLMICANPDLVVERGDKIIYCAGSLADAYAALGGEVIYAGKPYRPIYDRAFALAIKARGAAVPLARTLVIGDAIRTDISGAAMLGADSLFVTAGIHAHEIHSGSGAIDDAKLAAFMQAAAHRPRYVMQKLVW